jgi:hypothetical protein
MSVVILFSAGRQGSDAASVMRRECAMGVPRALAESTKLREVGPFDGHRIAFESTT